MSLIRLAKEGKLDEIKKNFRLLAGYAATVNDHDAEGKTALIWAAMNPSENAVSILEFLLKHGANPDVQDAEGNTALILLCNDEDSELGQSEISERIKLLLKNNANLNLQNKDGWTAPMYFNYQANWDNFSDVIEITKLFLKGGYNPNIQDANGQTWLHKACIISNPIEAGEMIVPYTDLTLKDKRGKTVLMEYMDDVADRENTDRNSLFFKLLTHGADINAVDSNGKTTLMYAAKASRTDGGEDPDYTEPFDDVAHCVERVKMLLRLGANPYVKWQGKTAADLTPLDAVKTLLMIPDNNEDPGLMEGGRTGRYRRTARRRFQKRR